MEWFSEWWDSLALFSQIMYCVAVPATLILIIQTIMILVGIGGDGAGVNPSDTSGFDGGTDLTGIDSIDSLDITGSSDISVDGGNPSDIGTMNFFTVQGFITFLCVFGWAGIVTYASTGIIIVSVLIAFVLGAAAMFGVAKLLQATAKLAQNGTVNVKNLLGASGTVYLVVPEKGNGIGKVMVTTDERCVEYSAITDGDEKLGDGTTIRVVDVRTGNVLVVEKA